MVAVLAVCCTAAASGGGEDASGRSPSGGSRDDGSGSGSGETAVCVCVLLCAVRWLLVVRAVNSRAETA